MLVMKEAPRHNIVSVRINDEERELLDQISRKTRKTVSEIIRDAMQLATPNMVSFYEQNRYPMEFAHDYAKNNQ